MNPFGIDLSLRRLTFPLRPVIYRDARREISQGVRRRHRVPLVVDIGGRRSSYTLGLPVRLVVPDRPPAGEQQERLRLGLTAPAARELLARRRNVVGVVLNDATRACFRSDAADGVIAVEVLEHVRDDESFVAEAARILDPDGWFVMTTPNGDAKPVPTNPDHVRHYRRHDLEQLLERWFLDVQVRYAVVTGRWHRLGLRSWDRRRPVSTLVGMVANTVNHLQSRPRRVMDRRQGTNHLLAVARYPSRQLPE